MVIIVGGGFVEKEKESTVPLPVLTTQTARKDQIRIIRIRKRHRPPMSVTQCDEYHVKGYGIQMQV